MPPSAETSSILSDVASTLSLRRILRRVTTKRSRKSLAGNSNDDKQPHSRSSSYISYSVYQQVMAPIILRDPDATRKLLDAILDSSNGRRSLSRLARTCKAMREPALDALWRELPSLLPLIGLFPSALMKKARKPGLGFTKMPAEDDWKKVLAYGERVRRIGYDEGLNNVASSIFTVIEEYRPRTYILPNLLQLSWKAETPIGLDRCSLFLNPELQGLFLEIGTRFPQLNAFLADMCSRTHLTAFSFISPMSLPDTFTELLLPQDALEKLVLVAPGALAPGIGKWAASLPRLRTLQLDLTGRSVIAVEGFFDDIRSAQSGASTPSSVGSPDSGVFSGDEIDFSEIRKASLRLTGDLHSSKGTFAQLTQLHLTGEASNIAVFMKHLTGSLAVLELVIEDPPDKADWQDLSTIISERFGSTLQSLRVTATGSSRFSDLVRSTSRMEPPSNHLSLAHFASLERLVRFEIDLPESIIFHNADMEHLAKACPNVEVVRLCPVARFPPTAAPYLTLEGLAPLMSGCRRLHTLAVVINAKGGSDETLAFRPSSSRSLLRLHVGHSWVSDPLQVTILLSHFAPHLELLKWYQEKNRPGFVEARAQEWQKVSDFLPYLQNLRLTERAGAIAETVAPPQNTYVPPQKVDKAIDATVITVDRGIFGGQFLPVLVNRMVEAKPEVFSISVDATPSVAEAGVYAATPVSHQSVDARPSTTSTGVAAITFTESKSTATESLEIEKPADDMHQTGSFTVPSVSDVFSFACRFLISYPLYIPLRILELSLSPLHARREEPSHELESEKDGPSSGSSTVSSESSDISPVCV